MGGEVVFPIRCPECGLINHRDDPSYPQCGHCHTDLARCTYCRHHEGRGCRHSRAYVNYTDDGEAAKFCAEFRSHDEVRGSRMTTKVPAPLWVSSLLLLIFLSLTFAAWFIDPLGRYFIAGDPLRVETTVPEQVVAGQPFTASMHIINLLNRPSTRLYVEFDRDFLDTVEWSNLSPQPVRMDRSQNRLLLEYHELPAGADSLLKFTFIAHERGIAPFAAKIYAPSTQLQRNITVPIRVS